MTARESISLIAAAAVEEVDGVAGPPLGVDGRYGTTVAGRFVPGVVTAASADGGYDVTLYVRARPVPLVALGDRIAAHVTNCVTFEGWVGSLASVRVVVLDVVTPEEEPA
jgi:hypothetical protein